MTHASHTMFVVVSFLFAKRTVSSTNQSLLFSGQSSQPSWSSDAKVASILCDVALLRRGKGLERMECNLFLHAVLKIGTPKILPDMGVSKNNGTPKSSFPL